MNRKGGTKLLPFQIKETTGGIGGMEDCRMVHSCICSLTTCTLGARWNSSSE